MSWLPLKDGTCMKSTQGSGRGLQLVQLVRRLLNVGNSLAYPLLISACGAPAKTFPVDQVCQDTGYAIAARVMDCSDDPDLATTRFEAFNAEYNCLVQDLDYEPVDIYYHCVAQVSNATCDQVASFGDDLSRYLTLSPTCSQFLSGPGLEASGSTGLDGGAP
jgi:hypothetical protein